MDDDDQQIVTAFCVDIDEDFLDYDDLIVNTLPFFFVSFPFHVSIL